MLKSEIRQEIRNRKRQFTTAQLGELSLAAIQKLLIHPRITQSKTILLYYSLPDEVDTHEAIDILVRNGKTILLPAVIDDTRMEIRRYNDTNDLRKGSFNIMEPIGQLFTAYDDIDVAVIPGMSFDDELNRLGRGKGYYDRFLQHIPNVYKIGICFDFQKVKALPSDKYDIKMDEVII